MDSVLLAQSTQYTTELVLYASAQLVSSPMSMESALENVDKMRSITKEIKLASALLD